MLQRRHLLSFAAATALPCLSSAQEVWPQKPIRIINPGAAGGTNDILSRYITEPLSRLLGQPVFVDNKPGAGGILGVQYMLQQPADGYTILTHHTALVTSPLLSPNARYDALKDVVPLSLKGTAPLVLMVHPSMPATLSEFVAYGRANPRKLEWGTSALGGVGHLGTEVFNDAAGIKDTVRIAYSGSAPALQALVGGQIKYLLSSITAATAGLVQEGKIRILGVASPARTSLAPGIPAIAEVVPGVEVESFYGFVARSGTPRAIAAQLSETIAKVIAQPEIAEKFRGIGIQPAKGGQEEFAALIQREHQRWSQVIREKAIKLDA
ncbi:Bug family tripartite tricarboxylate transporter substrate binding protein [Variovorax sp. JS1663]|uniref:Bug family tripartite tricarboxylate transporter substrate binding protein n=1 Tax=Variovorax sp. JS1663 TaxID=1851577 RepID=UPI000B344299|nr:tripartite tricarboxylate transporter substrate binding protein [Variovorax sp. JS1663]OUM00788.1 hypothetical protein A8M77_19025 [Variovorax sp. JS1663]